jgi:ATP-dependent DNA helicase PIF1
VDGIIPTELFPLRNEVDRANASRLKALPSHTHTFVSRDSGSAPPEKRATVLSNMIAQERLHLKTDAQVMLIKNADDVLVNGTVGRVLGFFAISEVVGGGGEVSKGGSGAIRNVQVEANGRTPIKRVENKENEGPEDTKKGKTKAIEDSGEKFPLVEFRTTQGKETVLVGRDEFRVEDNEGNVIARRVQVLLLPSL